MTLIPAGGGLGVNVARVPFPKPGLRFHFSLNMKSVNDQLGKTKARGLRKAGYKVMGSARKSIRKMGMAKPALAVMKTYRNLSLGDIAKLPGTRSETAPVARDSQGRFLAGGGKRRSVDGQITERDRRKVLERIREIQTKPPSAPGTPPHTHTGIMRRDIIFDYDRNAEAVVVGSFMAGGAWLASLHEFGGTQRMQAWAFIPKYEGRYRGILAWYRLGRGPKRRGSWERTNFQQTFPYPQRSYMAAAMRRMIASNAIVAEFRNQFRVGGG